MGEAGLPDDAPGAAQPTATIIPAIKSARIGLSAFMVKLQRKSEFIGPRLIVYCTIPSYGLQGQNGTEAAGLVRDVSTPQPKGAASIFSD
jgi:hypothetical protein